MSRTKCFCVKCGIISSISATCGNCGNTIYYDINPKWNITDEKWAEMYAKVKYGEITLKEFDEQWYEYCRPFTEEVIMKRPEFSPEAHARLPEYLAAQREWYEKKFSPNNNKPKINTNTISSVQCPYCKSHDTKKISATSRAFSIGFFGLGSKKIGKQWHCNSCGSDF